MKTINVNNYKEYAIDYMIGNLSVQEAEDFTSFLSEHPDIADEVLLFDTDKELSGSHHAPINKLKKEISQETITDDNFEEYCIAAMENDLSSKALRKLNNYVGNDAERQMTRALFKQTILQPEAINYPHKAKLKKAVAIPFFRRRFINIAASIAAASLIAFVLLFTLPDTQKTMDELADNASIKTLNTHNEGVSQGAKSTVEITKELPQEEQNIQAVAEVKSTPTPSRKESSTTESTRPEPSLTAESKIKSVPLEKLTLKRTNLAQTHIAIPNIDMASGSMQYANIENTQPNDNEARLRSQTKKLIYSTVLAQSIKSINKMAETDLGYDVVEDENGTPVRVIVKSRFGEIDRALAQR